MEEGLGLLWSAPIATAVSVVVVDRFEGGICWFENHPF